MIDLYPDQEEFIQEVRNLWKENLRIVGVCPTGFGKTRCAAKIIQGFVSRGMKVCFIVPRISLIQQTADAFTDLGLTDITYLWADYPTDYDAKITIASVDTYIRRKKMTFDLVIVDEVQHKRKTLLEWMDSHPEERYLGLTATAFAPWIGSYYSAMAKSKPMWWLMENNRLSKYDVFAPSKPDLSGVKTVNTPHGKDYKEAELAEIMNGAKLVGDVVANWLEHGENRLTIALCVNIAHAGHLTNEFNNHGIKAEIITHHVPVNDRQAIFRRATDGITKIILSVDCLTEGFDMPEASCLINARPTQSKTRFIQGIGRILRYVEGKRAIIFDHAASFINPELGFVEYIETDDLCSESDGLDEVAVKRKEKEQKEKLPTECKKCNYLKQAGVLVCPQCGYRPLAGENVEIDESRGLKALKKTKVTMIDKQQFYSELLHYQQTRLISGKPFSDGALAHLYRSKFSVWPKGLNSIKKQASFETLNYIKSRQIAFAKSQNR